MRMLGLTTKLQELVKAVSGRVQSLRELPIFSRKAFAVEEKKGDLFTESSGSDSLAHCVSVDLRMGKGIATMFKKQFGGVGELQKQNVQVGGVAVLQRDGRFIYYLITKDKYFQKPTMASLMMSLCAMRDHCLSHSVRHVSMPRVGCGLDQLQWPQVLQGINYIFQNTGMTITVYSLD